MDGCRVWEETAPGGLVRRGLEHHAAGRLAEAADCYLAAHRENPKDAEALMLLGMLARQAGRPEDAVRLGALAVELRPRNAGFLASLAQAHLAAGHTTEAERCCRSALGLNPRLAAAWCCLGDAALVRGDEEQARIAWEKAAACPGRSARAERLLGHWLCRRGRLDEAVVAYGRGLAKTPRDAVLHYAMGAALAAGGRRTEAKAAYRRALQLRTAFPEAWLNLGNVLYDEGEWAQAALCCRKALALRPRYAKAWSNLGNALQMLGGARAATRCYEQSLAIEPNLTAATHNLGNAWMARQQFGRAEECFRKTLESEAERAEHHNSLGNALFQQRRNQEAEACYRRALELEPEYATAHTNLANVLMKTGDQAEMIRHYERAVELDPQSAGGHYNLALAYLREGRYCEGWREHEWRWEFRELKLRRRKFAARQWKGEPLSGETILLHAEQGLGDTMQFVRYAPLVAERGGTVVLEVQPRLVRLLRDIPGVSCVIARGDALPEFAWHCPLMSLPAAFATTMDTIPADIPYLRADAAEAEAARRRWGGDGLRVGLTWSGNPKFRGDRERSVTPRALLPLAEVEGISWFSLQMGAAVNPMRALAAEFPLADACSASRDFAETAAMMATLDLTISVDTAVTHLAGGMGVPVWVMLPHLADWRWMDNREDSAWYPTARLFRQRTAGEWAEPVARMREELKKIVAERKGCAAIGRRRERGQARWEDANMPGALTRVTGCGAGMGPG